MFVQQKLTWHCKAIVLQFKKYIRDLFLLICYFPTYCHNTNGFSCASSYINTYRIHRDQFQKYSLPVYTTMVLHSSTLAWKIPWMEEPSRLQFMESLRVGHDWATSLSLFTFMHWRRKWQPTPMFLPGESQGLGSLVGCCLWGCTESDMTKWLSSSSLYYMYVFLCAS